jgi:hypothetical protein
MTNTEKTHFGLEAASVKGFCNFLRNNIPLVIAVSVTLFFVYGIKLFYFTIGADTERYMAANGVLYTDDANKGPELRWINQGRFSLVWMQKLLHINGFNPYTAFFVTFCLIWLFTLSWCYCLALFDSKPNMHNNKLIAFALAFMTTPFLAEQFYWVLQSAEVAFIVLLCPYCIHLLYSGVFENSRRKLFLTFALLVFMTSVYQAIVPLFCYGVLVCFLLIHRNSHFKAHTCRIVCAKIAAIVLGALIVYFIMNNIVIAIYGGRKEFDLVEWSVYNNKFELRSFIFNFLRYLYIITLGGIPPVYEISSKFLARFLRTGNAFTTAFDQAKIFGNIILLPLIAVFLVKIGKNAKRKITPENRLLFFLAGIGMCAVIFILPLMPGGQAMRSQFALPFAAAFMMFYLITEYQKYLSKIIFAAALITAFYQAHISAQLFYSDYIRYMADVQLAIDLDKRIIAVQHEAEKLPVALIGKYSPAITNNYIKGEALGVSEFERSASNYSESGRHGLPFMRSLGKIYELADYSQMETARTAALDMPAYPDPGCVKCLPDVIVVKLSDSSVYRPE